MFLSFGSVIIGILAFIFVLGAIILIHEGGHFFFAVRAGILCREYSFGMGPQLLHTKKGETEYSIRALPIGGFCAIAGEEKEDDVLKDKKQVRLVIEDNIVKKICIDVDEELFKDIPLFDLYEYDLYDEAQTGNLYMKVSTPSENEEEAKIVEYKVDPKACYIYTGKAYKNSNLDFGEKKKKFTKEFQIAPYNRQMNSKPLGKRIMVIFGGPMMNMVLAVFAFLVSSLLTGVSNVDVTKLSGVSEGSPAYEAGLRDGDVIYGLETIGKDSNVLKDIEIKKNGNTYYLERKNKKEDKLLKLIFNDKNKITLNEMKKYASKNKYLFLTNYTNWLNEVNDEVTKYNFFENLFNLKIFGIIYGIIGFIVTILIIKDQYIKILFCIISLLVILFSILIYKRTNFGKKVYKKFNDLKKQINDDHIPLKDLDTVLVYSIILNNFNKLEKNILLNINNIKDNKEYIDTIKLYEKVHDDIMISIKNAYKKESTM